MKFTLNRDKVVVGAGHVIGFKKGVPTHVPPTMYKDVLSAGATPEDEMEDDDSKVTSSAEPSDPDERKQRIVDAMKAMARENAREDFTGTGMPTIPAMTARLGFKIDPKERDALWTELRQNQE